MQKRIAISMGDYNGIGPEVTLKCLANRSHSSSTPIILGHHSVYEFYSKRFGIDLPYISISNASEIEDGTVNILNCCKEEEVQIKIGSKSKLAGSAAMQSVEMSIKLCLNNTVNALVTSPISKEAIQLAGYDYPGHTEFLSEKTGCDDFMMILVSDRLRVGLVTGHIPISQVANSINKDAIVNKIKTMNSSLIRDFGINMPRIAVFGLNPHAGDGGVLGNEEETIIRPAIETAVKTGIKAEGPFPADGFFGNNQQDHYDGIVAMYHDQGLVPFKALSFGSGVNFTAGLPIIRTSPDHGTAFGIAGKSLANPASFTAAFELASEMIETRNQARYI